MSIRKKVKEISQPHIQYKGFISNTQKHFQCFKGRRKEESTNLFKVNNEYKRTLRITLLLRLNC